MTTQKLLRILGPIPVGTFFNAGAFDTAFLAYCGFNADFTTAVLQGLAEADGFINSVELLSVTGDVLDRYGGAGVNGRDQSWDYNQGWAYRYSGTCNDKNSFQEEDWEIGGAFALQSFSNNFEANPWPLGEYEPPPELRLNRERTSHLRRLKRK